MKGGCHLRGVDGNGERFSSGESRGEGELEAVATPVQLGGRTHVWSVEMRQGRELIARTTLRTMILR